MIQLKLSVERDVCDDFTKLVNFSPSLPLTKEASINIERKSANGKEQFEVYIVDKTMRLQDSAVINLNQAALFKVVQKCRSSWEKAFEQISKIRLLRSGRQQRYCPFEEKWDQAIDADAFNKLAGKLAVAGDTLFRGIFERNRGTRLDQVAAQLRRFSGNGAKAFTVNSPDFHIPWRMLYTHPNNSEELRPDGANFVPAGFWGYQHVVEQFTNKHDINDHVLARKGKLGFGAALHDQIDTCFDVECISHHRDFTKNSGSLLACVEWTTTAGLLEALSAPSFEHQILYFLCHAEERASYSPFLQLSDGEIDVEEIRDAIQNRFHPSPPLVFINACRGGQLGTLIMHNFTFATEFLEQGAVCVVGPQIEVPAVFAGRFGRSFFHQFVSRSSPPPQVGIVLRAITREMWDKHLNPFGLVYSLYAGADVHVRWDEVAP